MVAKLKKKLASETEKEHNEAAELKSIEGSSGASKKSGGKSAVSSGGKSAGSSGVSLKSKSSSVKSSSSKK